MSASGKRRGIYLWIALCLVSPGPSAPSRSSTVDSQLLSPSDLRSLSPSELGQYRNVDAQLTRHLARPGARSPKRRIDPDEQGQWGQQPPSPTAAQRFRPSALQRPKPTHFVPEDQLGPGQGGWHITYSTVSAQGKGCDVDWLEVEVGEVQDTKLVINQQDNSDCSPGSDQCIYQLFWKCAELDEEEKKPRRQDMAVRIDVSGQKAAGVTVEHSYESFDGKMTVMEEKYAISQNSLKGTTKWRWVSEDGQQSCDGEDQIKGKRGHSMACDTDADDEGWNLDQQEDSFGETKAEALRRKASEPKKGDENFYQEHVAMPYLEGDHELTDEFGEPVSYPAGTIVITVSVLVALAAVGFRFGTAKRPNQRFRDAQSLERGEEHLTLPLRG